MNKKVAFGAKPSQLKLEPATAGDDWVKNRGDVALKRLTFDVPETLHRDFKIYCTANGLKMKDQIIELMEQRLKVAG